MSVVAWGLGAFGLAMASFDLYRVRTGRLLGRWVREAGPAAARQRSVRRFVYAGLLATLAAVIGVLDLRLAEALPVMLLGAALGVAHSVTDLVLWVKASRTWEQIQRSAPQSQLYDENQLDLGAGAAATNRRRRWSR
ncbi:hypothetical protein [Nonomuraea insulae]|uniref:Uncharacterized protein n=1 Tax=Nonomuraea insulae TaxID=1616787 RepID=A0ABW1CK49_9ACTN